MSTSGTESTVAKAAVGVTIGAVAGSIANSAPVLHRVPGAAAANFGSATANALKHHASLSRALGAGATAALGGPAVVGVVVAAAPVVLTVAATAAAVAGAIAFVNWLNDK